MNYYPVLLDLVGRPVAVVGGGTVALEKVHGLLEAGASITIYAPKVLPALGSLAAEGRITVVPREPAEVELASAALVLAERRSPEENSWVFRAVDQGGRFVNVQDDVPHSSFIAPAILRQGDLVVSISTSGAAPALAVRLKEYLGRQLGSEYGRFLALARRYRRPLAERVPDFGERRSRWYRLVDSPVWQHLRSGKTEDAESLATQILGVHPDE